MQLQRAAFLSVASQCWRKKGCMPSPCGWPRKPLLLLTLLMKPRWSPLLNANALTSCQTLNPSCPQDNLPQPQKLTISPNAWALRGVLLTGFAANFLCSICFYKRSHQNWQHPLVRVGNALERAWRLGPVLAVGGGQALRHARRITHSMFFGCPTNDIWH